MKKILLILLTITMLSFSILCTPVSAASTTGKVTAVTIEYLENGDYIETIITYEEALTRSSKTASKTKNYKNSDGDVMWSVTVRGTFSYNGTTSSCTAVSHSTTTLNAYWSIKSASSSKSGNTATAKAVATQSISGVSRDYSVSVSLTCSANGTLS